MPNNIGAFGENFPYSNQHDMNMDWIIKIAKDFLDQYSTLQQTITEGMEGLENKATELENLLQAWYDTHSEDIANELASALQDLNEWYTQHQGYLDDYVTSSITFFTQQANAKVLETLQTIPEDYTVLSKRVVDITGNEYGAFDNDILFGTEWTIGKYCNPSGSNLITNAGYNTSDYIPSAPMKVYYIPDHTGVFVHFFDSSKTFISGRAVTNPLFSTPSNTRFIRISVEVSNPNSTHVITDEIVEMTDYIENTTWTDDIYIEGGQTHTNTAWTTSDFIPVYASRYVTMFNCAGCFFNYYDNNKTWLSGYSRTTNATIQLPTDERTAYLKISLQKINQPTAHLNGNVPTYTKFGKSAFDFITQHKKSIKPEIHIGQGYQFTTLREGIAYACNTGNCKVFVHPGTYDLVTEFANEISDTMSYTGIGLGNNVEIYFYDGAKVTANITYDQYSMEVIGRTTEYFNPFYSFAEGDWKLENLNMEATNTRYCVHDETSGTGVARQFPWQQTVLRLEPDTAHVIR